jgi:Tol biopolymer transport system component
MTSQPRLERSLPALLEDLYLGPSPDYRDEVMAAVGHTRQRPAWTFPERWLPMADITTRLSFAPRLPLRALGLALLVLALIAAGLLIYVGSQHRHPAPFGPAGNGLIPFVSGGDVYLGDPVAGSARLLVGGPENDALVGTSPDGARLAFIREVHTAGGASPVDIYVVRTDESDPHRITQQPIADLQVASWTPDGNRLAVVHQDKLDLLDAAGSGSVARIPTTGAIDSLQFRPPDGREVLYRALVDGKYGLYVTDLNGTPLRTLVEPTIANMDLDLGGAVYSADGGRIFYQRADAGGCCRLWTMNADGTNAHEFVPPPRPAWQGQPVVSPDGAWIAFWRVMDSTQSVSVVRADGNGPVISTGPKLTDTANWVWAPDSSKILMYPNDGSSTSAYLLDPSGGPWSTVPWGSDADLDWQRILP